MTKVKIYTTPECPWCKKAKEFFKEHGVKYTEIDVAGDEKAAKEMIDISGQMGVPVTVVDSQVIVGFDKPALKKALKIK